MERTVRTVDDVFRVLDGLFTAQAGGASWWDDFYADPSRPIPFLVAKPDENLVAYQELGLLRPGRALDLGCGPGRNAVWLGRNGFVVDAVDLSPVAIARAEERAAAAGAAVRFRCGDIFAPDVIDGPYDLVYDSGCFHHLPPHRRVSYLALLSRVLVPGGCFGLACFTLEEGSARADSDFYRTLRLAGGVGYSAESLRWIFADYVEVELRRMRDEPSDSAWFGEPFLWTALFRRA